MKKSAIKKVVVETFLSNHESCFYNSGFRFRKKDVSFIKSNDEFEYIISISTQSSFGWLYYDDLNKCFYFTFRLFRYLRLKRFESWYKQRFGGNKAFIHSLGHGNYYFTKSVSDFEKHDFSPNTNHNIHIRTDVLKELAKCPGEVRYISLEDYAINSLADDLELLDSPPSISEIFDNRSASLHPDYIDLLVYADHIELARKFYDLSFKSRCETLEKAIKNKAHNTKILYDELAKFSEKAHHLLNIEYQLPEYISIESE